MAYMSLRQYAKHRGCSLAAVQKAIETGRIRVAKEERHGQKVFKFINTIDADVDWQNNTDPLQQRTATRKDKGIVDDVSPFSPKLSSDNSEQISLFPDPSKSHASSGGGGTSKAATGAYGEMYSKARAVHETWAAKSAEIEYKKSVNALVDVDLVRSKLFSLGSDIKLNILTITPRVSAFIYAALMAYIEESKENPAVTFNKKEIEDILNGELSACLEGLVNGHFGI